MMVCCECHEETSSGNGRGKDPKTGEYLWACHSCDCKTKHDAFQCEVCQKYDAPSSWMKGALRYPGLCHTCCFWQEKVENKGSPRQLVVDHQVYQDLGPKGNGPSKWWGFAGARFCYQRFDAEAPVETWNMWYNGLIPEVWRSKLPDNARFLKEAK